MFRGGGLGLGAESTFTALLDAEHSDGLTTAELVTATGYSRKAVKAHLAKLSDPKLPIPLVIRGSFQTRWKNRAIQPTNEDLASIAKYLGTTGTKAKQIARHKAEREGRAVVLAQWRVHQVIAKTHLLSPTTDAWLATGQWIYLPPGGGSFITGGGQSICPCGIPTGEANTDVIRAWLCTACGKAAQRLTPTTEHPPEGNSR